MTSLFSKAFALQTLGAPCTFAVRQFERFAAGDGYSAMTKKMADNVRQLSTHDMTIRLGIPIEI